MPKQDDATRLCHMLDAARKAVTLAADRNRNDLDADETLGLAIVRLLEILGEAARGVSQSFQDGHPKIAWKEMIGARNHLIHGYYEVDYDIVWQILKDDLPPLIQELEKAVGEKDL
jgi:uncharacterized protein with HEPN domain